MQGGGSRINAIVDALRPYEADILVLTEFKNNARGDELCGKLKEFGYGHMAAPKAEPNLYTVLVAGREPFEAVTFPGEMSDPELGDFSKSIMLAKFTGLNVFGSYFPGSERKRPVLDFLLNLDGSYLQNNSLIMGDFNVGLHGLDEAGATFIGADQFQALLDKGWIDAWRSRNPEVREFSWYSKGYNNGFRLDHTFVTPSLDARIKDVRYEHKERERKVSDHSIMLVDFD